MQAVLDESLRDRFNEDWWRNAKAGPRMVGAYLLGWGQRVLDDEPCRGVAAEGPLLRAWNRRHRTHDRLTLLIQSSERCEWTVTSILMLDEVHDIVRTRALSLQDGCVTASPPRHASQCGS